METPGEVLRKLGMKGILTLPPEKGGVSQVLCDVDECYCPRGRGWFEPISQDEKGALVDWMPTGEHWPVGQAEHGLKTKGNIWLAHRLCNKLAGLDQERRRAIAKKQQWAKAHPLEYRSEFGNREAAEAQWRQHSPRRQAHPVAAQALEAHKDAARRQGPQGSDPDVRARVITLVDPPISLRTSM